MKTTILFLLLFCFSLQNLYAQREGKETTEKRDTIPPSMVASIGFVPCCRYNSLKVGGSFNNLFFKKLGVYTSFEKGINSGYFSHIYGITWTIHKNAYLWTGIDFYTRYGLFTHSKSCGIRKEIGIGIIPIKNFVINTGWSYDVGVSLEVGLRLPLTLRHSIKTNGNNIYKESE